MRALQRATHIACPARARKPGDLLLSLKRKVFYARALSMYLQKGVPRLVGYLCDGVEPNTGRRYYRAERRHSLPYRP
jgi:hypothetical protein